MVKVIPGVMLKVQVQQLLLPTTAVQVVLDVIAYVVAEALLQTSTDIRVAAIKVVFMDI